MPNALDDRSIDTLFLSFVFPIVESPSTGTSQYLPYSDVDAKTNKALSLLSPGNSFGSFKRPIRKDA